MHTHDYEDGPPHSGEKGEHIRLFTFSNTLNKENTLQWTFL